MTPPPSLPRVLRDAQLPSCVAELPNPPSELHLCGSIPTRPMVAIVGTRRPTREAEEFAHELAQNLVARGFAVASGGATGIDSAAHRGALLAKGQTLVVAPSGWYAPYPACNQSMFEQIVALDGGYVSLVAPHTKPASGNFFARNALMVALAKATVLGQAPLRSGARNAAHAARKLGRPLYVVPSAPWTEQGLGCVQELIRGARPLGTVRDLLAGLGDAGAANGDRAPQLRLTPDSPTSNDSPSSKKQISGPTRQPQPVAIPPSNPELRLVSSALTSGCHTLDEVCTFTGWTLPQAQGALLRLTLDGHIRVTSAGRIELVCFRK